MTVQMYELGYRIATEAATSTVGHSAKNTKNGLKDHQTFRDQLRNLYGYIRDFHRDDLIEFSQLLHSSQNVKNNYKIWKNLIDSSFEFHAVRPIAHWLLKDEHQHSYDNFKESVDTLIDLWSSPSFEMTFYAAIHGVISFPGLHGYKDYGFGWAESRDSNIKSVINDDKNRLNRGIGDYEKISTTLILCKCFSIDKDQEINSSAAVNEIMIILLSLRACNLRLCGCTGLVGLMTEKYIPVQEFSKFIQPTPYLTMNKFGLTPLHEEAMKQHLQLVHKIRRTYDECAFGVKRLAMLSSRQDWIDQVVDLSIALESILLPGFSTELGYRLRLRASHLLRHSEWGSHDVFREMKKLYETRSNIVHANHKMADEARKLKPNPTEALDKWYQMSLAVLRTISELAHDCDCKTAKVIDKVDQDIIGKQEI